MVIRHVPTATLKQLREILALAYQASGNDIQPEKLKRLILQSTHNQLGASQV